MPINPSFPVQLFVPVPYAGPLTAVNVALLTGGGIIGNVANGAQQILQAGHQSKVVNTVYDWENTYTGNAVALSFQNNNQGAALLLDKILMVYINNVDNINDVTVYFPDSGHLVTCPAFSSGYFPVFTNIFTCYVYNGYGSAVIPQAITQQTQILFCNFAIPAFVSPIEATVPLYVGYPINFTTSGAPSFVEIFPAGFDYYLYGIQLTVTNINAAAAGLVIAAFQIGTTQAGGPSSNFGPYVEGVATATATGQQMTGSWQYRGNYDSNPLDWNAIANNPTFGQFPNLGIWCTHLTNAVASGVIINIGYKKL